MLQSKLIRQEDFNSNWHKRFARVLKEDENYVHRKIAEWTMVMQAMDERGLLKAGTKALSFGAGKEPLPAALATFGVETLATDLAEDDPMRLIWQASDQWGGHMAELNTRGICDDATFNRLVSFDYCDMNNIPEKYHNQFDVTYSCCSMEHLGSIARGLQFLEESSKCLKSGGVGIHSMEFNVGSDTDTIDFNETVLFRKSDVMYVRRNLLDQGYKVELPDWSYGDLPKDLWVDTAPFSSNVGHLKLQLWHYVSASFVMIIEKP